MTSARDIGIILNQYGVAVSELYISECLQNLNLISGNRIKSEDIADVIYSHYLNSDLSMVGVQTLPPNVKDMHKQVLDGPFILQIEEIVNISSNMDNRYTDSSNRTLKCLMSDGHQKVIGLELEKISQLSAASYVAGVKIYVKNIQVKRGMLLLTPHTVHVLGGQVNMLEEIHKRHIEERLAAREGSKIGQGGGLGQGTQTRVASATEGVTTESKKEEIAVGRTVSVPPLVAPHANSTYGAPQDLITDSGPTSSSGRGTAYSSNKPPHSAFASSSSVQSLASDASKSATSSLHQNQHQHLSESHTSPAPAAAPPPPSYSGAYKSHTMTRSAYEPHTSSITNAAAIPSRPPPPLPPPPVYVSVGTTDSYNRLSYDNERKSALTVSDSFSNTKFNAVVHDNSVTASRAFGVDNRYSGPQSQAGSGSESIIGSDRRRSGIVSSKSTHGDGVISGHGNGNSSNGNGSSSNGNGNSNNARFVDISSSPTLTTKDFFHQAFANRLHQDMPDVGMEIDNSSLDILPERANQVHSEIPSYDKDNSKKENLRRNVVDISFSPDDHNVYMKSVSSQKVRSEKISNRAKVPPTEDMDVGERVPSPPDMEAVNLNILHTSMHATPTLANANIKANANGYSTSQIPYSTTSSLSTKPVLHQTRVVTSIAGGDVGDRTPSTSDRYRSDLHLRPFTDTRSNLSYKDNSQSSTLSSSFSQTNFRAMDDDIFLGASTLGNLLDTAREHAAYNRNKKRVVAIISGKATEMTTFKVISKNNMKNKKKDGSITLSNSLSSLTAASNPVPSLDASSSSTSYQVTLKFCDSSSTSKVVTVSSSLCALFLSMTPEEYEVKKQKCVTDFGAVGVGTKHNEYERETKERIVSLKNAFKTEIFQKFTHFQGEFVAVVSLVDTSITNLDSDGSIVIIEYASRKEE